MRATNRDYSQLAMPAPPSGHTLPATQVLSLIELLKRWNIRASELLAPFGLEESALEQANMRVSTEMMCEMLERARSLTGEPGLGFYLGLQKRVSFYGFVGYAAMSAATLREALELSVRFAPLVTTALSLRLQQHGDIAGLTIETHDDMGSARDIATLSLLIGLRQIGSALTGRALTGRADFAMPEPSYYSRFAHIVPDARFDQPTTQLVFAAADLDLPLVAPDPAALRVLQKQCEEALLALGFDCTLEQRVRRMLPQTDGFRSLEEVAVALAISPRTLKRKLANRGTTFSELLDRERCERALLMLGAAHYSIDDIAQRLGYSTPPNFVRAFRRWMGTTPAAYRRSRS
jgi:AraC-like DNA-binding protein